VLLRGGREAKESNDAADLTRGADDLAAALRALPAATDLDTLRGLEGEAARQYFARLKLIVRPEAREHFSMDGRSRRPPRDRFNALLSFLDERLPFSRRSRRAGPTGRLPPRPAPRPCSPGLDLMEEFRAIADRVALTLINRGQIGG
jgi:CRISPR-associated protein Cas1